MILGTILIFDIALLILLFYLTREPKNNSMRVYSELEISDIESSLKYAKWWQFKKRRMLKEDLKILKDIY